MRTKTFLLGAFAIIMLTACSNDENGVIDSPVSKAAFSATIDGPVTRAFNQTWDPGDAIGISGTSGTKAYTNVAYQTTGNGNFTVVTDGKEIYYQDNQPVMFTAYYPWNDLQGKTFIDADTWLQADQKTFDFLWAQAPGSKADPTVAFTFSHRMAKVVLTIKTGADVSLDEVKAAVMSLGGFKHTGKFDVVNEGKAEATDNGTGLWQFSHNTGENGKYNAPMTVEENAKTVSYTLIMFPQAFGKALPITATLPDKQTFEAELDFTAANEHAGDTNPQNEWVAGRQYNLSITLHKTDIEVKGCTIEEWKPADGGNVDAE